MAGHFVVAKLATQVLSVAEAQGSEFSISSESRSLLMKLVESTKDGGFNAFSASPTLGRSIHRHLPSLVGRPRPLGSSTTGA